MDDTDRFYLTLLAETRDDAAAHWRAWCLAVKTQIRPRLMAGIAAADDPHAALDAVMGSLSPAQLSALCELPSRPFGAPLA